MVNNRDTPKNYLFDPSEAIEQVKKLIPYLFIGPVFVHRRINGEINVEVPLMYNGFALDRIHFDLRTNSPAPKGHNPFYFNIKVDKKRIKLRMEKILSELKVLDATEFRDPESAWAIPLVWNHFIIAHIKVNFENLEILQDYPLTQEVRRSVF
ncbi:MAG: hypothetical protein ACTSQO_14760 [Candidatus Helarchaeota archaeon]